MKREKAVTALQGWVLACLVSIGPVWAMITAFDLTIRDANALALVCVLSAAVYCAAFSFRWGGIPAACLTALVLGYLWHRGEAEQQLYQLLYRLTYVYNRAYQWGVFKLVNTPWNAGAADLPMAVLGGLLSFVTARTVCRGKSSVPAVLLALIPLGSCLVVTDTVPAEWCLYLLLLGMILLILTGRVRKNNPIQGNRLTFMAAIPAALALAVLFLAVPQESYVNQSKKIQQDILAWFEEVPQKVVNTAQEITAGNGEPQRVDLTAMGRRRESTNPVMEVTTDVSGTLYLRGQDYDVYDGAGWRASDHREENFSCQGVDLGDVVIATESRMDQLYLPYYPANGMTLLDGRMNNTWQYSEYVIGRTGLPDGWQTAPDAPGTGEGRYLELPEDTRTGAEALLGTILSGESTTVETAEKIADFVRSSARYDLNTARMPEGEEDFALWFLGDSETGYCVHFATAAVVLLRAADIEARYVSGYMVRTEAGQAASVTGENAHAWAEYYLPSLDTWVVLEATPGDGLAAQPATQTPATEATLPPRETTLPTLPTTEAEKIPTVSQETVLQPKTKKAPNGAWKILLAAVVLLLILTGQRTLRMELRRRQMRTGTPNARALAQWRETERIAKLSGELPPENLKLLAQKAKFSQHTLTAEELGQFDSHLRTARAQLREKPWYVRLVHQYIFAAY